MTTTLCEHCTVPTPGPSVCTFCINYSPPATLAQRLDGAAHQIDLIRTDINAVIRDMHDDTPMFAVVDAVNALWNLRTAAVLLDKAADAIHADETENPR